MRHARQRQLRDGPADVEIDHDRLAAVAAGADQVRVALVEEEVVDRPCHLGPAHREALACANRLLHALLVGVDQAEDLGRRVAVRDLPDLGQVLERHDEALPRGCLVDRGDARAALAPDVLDGLHLQRLERLGIEQDQGVRQVVGDGQHPAIVADRDVAGVDPGPDLGHRAEPPQVVTRDPAVARGEVDEAPVGAELGPAVEREAAWEAGQGLEPVAVQDGDVVIPGFARRPRANGTGAMPRRRISGGLSPSHAAGRCVRWRSPWHGYGRNSPREPRWTGRITRAPDEAGTYAV